MGSKEEAQKLVQEGIPFPDECPRDLWLGQGTLFWLQYNLMP